MFLLKLVVALVVVVAVFFLVSRIHKQIQEGNTELNFGKNSD
jgi:hypothetical protein